MQGMSQLQSAYLTGYQSDSQSKHTIQHFVPQPGWNCEYFTRYYLNTHGRQRFSSVSMLQIAHNMVSMLHKVQTYNILKVTWHYNWLLIKGASM